MDPLVVKLPFKQYITHSKNYAKLEFVAAGDVKKVSSLSGQQNATIDGYSLNIIELHLNTIEMYQMVLNRID